MDYQIHGAWAKDAGTLASALLVSTTYDAIVTCGPPHMVHEAGRKLALASGLPLIADLRDPWRLVQRLADGLDSRLWYWLAAFYETSVVSDASLIVMNTPKAQAAMQSLYPALGERIAAVMNGFDEEAPRAAQIRTKFVIAYAGVVYLDRNPGVVFRAMRRLIRSLGLTPDDIGLELMGHVDSYRGTSLHVLAEREGIADYLKILAPGSRDAALEFLSSATVLLSLPQDSDMAIPSKVFEYMQFEAWLLAIAQRDSATEQLLRDTDAWVVAPDDDEGVTKALTEMFLQHRRGIRPARLADSVPNASRRAQASLMLNGIEALWKSTAVPSEATAALGHEGR
jgi:glycosyltransferase involved in cell wall biosynthesis